MRLDDLPDEVILIWTDSEWPVDALVNDNDGIFEERVYRAVERRAESANVIDRSRVHVARARLTDLVELEVLPPVTTRPRLAPKGE